MLMMKALMEGLLTRSSLEELGGLSGSEKGFFHLWLMHAQQMFRGGGCRSPWNFVSLVS